MKPNITKIFTDYPEVMIYLDRIRNEMKVPTEDLKNLITLVSELSFRDGYIEGIKTIVKELLSSAPNNLSWVLPLTVVVLAERVSSWPYGVLMSVKNIF